MRRNVLAVDDVVVVVDVLLVALGIGQLRKKKSSSRWINHKVFGGIVEKEKHGQILIKSLEGRNWSKKKEKPEGRQMS